MYKTISNKIIREFKPCYDPSEVIKDENEELAIKEWVKKYREVVPDKDIIWLLSRTEFLSKKDLILFVVWCVKEALKLIETPDERIVEVCNVAERYANDQATKEELLTARDAANDVVNIASSNVARDAANAAYIAACIAVYDKTDTTYTVFHYASAASFYASTVALYASYDVTSDAAYANYYAARSAQLDQLLTYFE
jgi:hypothetical protein